LESLYLTILYLFLFSQNIPRTKEDCCQTLPNRAVANIVSCKININTSGFLNVAVFDKKINTGEPKPPPCEKVTERVVLNATIDDHRCWTTDKVDVHYCSGSCPTKHRINAETGIVEGE